MAKKNKKWTVYNDLAWVDLIVNPPEESREETESYCQQIIKNCNIKPKTLLHLGCGAGIMDHTFKKHFKVTGVDLSKGMLKIARKINPELIYIQGDMRKVRLKTCFDAVVIPDSIGYMTSVKEVRKAVNTADKHLNPGGVLLIVAQLREQFQDNNFAYSGKDKNVKITIFENNHIVNKSKYEATFFYLIRQKKKVKIHSEIHTLGIFESTTWGSIFKDQGFRVKKYMESELYQPFLFNNGNYPQVVFVCRKSHL